MLQNIRLKNRSYSNGFYSFHPYCLTAYFAGMFASVFKNSFSISDMSDIYGMCAILITLSIFRISVKGIKSCLKLLLLCFPSCIFIFVIALLTYRGSGRAFLYINDIPLTYDGLYAGVTPAFTISSLLLFFSLFSIYIDAGRTVFLLGRFFPSAAIMINMIYCFSDRYKITLDSVRDMGEQFGITTKSGSLLCRIQNGGHIYSSLVGIMLENSLDTASSMAARGFSHAKKNFNPYIFRTKDTILTSLSMAFLLSMILNISNIYMTILYIIFPVLYNIRAAVSHGISCRLFRECHNRPNAGVHEMEDYNADNQC